MQYKNTFAAAAILASTSLAAYVPSEPWSTLTPNATYSGAMTDYSGSFGIAVVPLATTTPSSSKSSPAATTTPATVKAAKRDAVSQIGDGQIQAATTTTTKLLPPKPTVVTTVSTSKTTSTSVVVKTTVDAISQIWDGQIQATTKTSIPPPVTTLKKTAAAVSQIWDGQVQATTKTQAPAPTTSPTPTPTPKQTAAAVSQIWDGQVQATTNTKKVTTLDGKSTSTSSTSTSSTSTSITTQVPTTTVPTFTSSSSSSATQTSSSSSAASSEDSFFSSQACKNNGTLTMTLKKGILNDAKGRVGSIVANRQFQFDGPPPQAGAIYAAGWSITPQGNLAIGANDIFYQCLSGDFYNLYDEYQGAQCQKVYLQAVELVDC
ncbi:hypothetical protein TBLA_0B00410 [Henningerozyma blattae CBS 6284]|uniref:Cell wall mannoprotein PIR1-like C-terminal domain-containing protein n=1 Tax=Henningerozyma blattae (strain ATCC 34711 / CBS 6284 / DSM 70876 / NBRC 10599 / NRRL Y-10934 / UCD 77-7) TaxID=1071380 RepID=I2GXN3_HENB6|nr:hypothetical protein TBLA_0B00410 [Tetrapisispora blattae CBS 6284]CCH58885.1 hypothetical protein TBLA_0B00410 [Tetrapisispora blattae CBS 6284]